MADTIRARVFGRVIMSLLGLIMAAGAQDILLGRSGAGAIAADAVLSVVASMRSEPRRHLTRCPPSRARAVAVVGEAVGGVKARAGQADINQSRIAPFSSRG